VRIAVAGAGMIGKRHIEEVEASDVAELTAIIDPGPAGPAVADKFGVPLYPSLADLFVAAKPEGVILATPNRMHVDGGLECVAAGVPVIGSSAPRDCSTLITHLALDLRLRAFAAARLASRILGALALYSSYRATASKT
jgi:hypothetical protein